MPTAIPFAIGQKVPPEFYPQRNLGMLSPARARGKFERVSLGRRDGGGHVFLEMAGHDVPNEQCRVELKTRVFETDRNGREIRERVLYQAMEHRECGGVPGGHLSSRPARRAADGGVYTDSASDLLLLRLAERRCAVNARRSAVRVFARTLGAGRFEVVRWR